MVKIAVLGAGANGLASAVRIKETFPEAEVVVISNEFTPNTTGDGSGGLWNPYLCGSTPEQSLSKWGFDTYKLYHKLWLEGGHNVTLVPLYSFFHGHRDIGRPKWADGVFGYRIFNDEQMKYFSKVFNNDLRSGSTYSSFVAHSSSILRYLTDRFTQANGKFLRAEVTSLRDPLLSEYDVAVNCTGLGARTLVPDSTVYPIRGQILKVSAPWVCEVVLDDDTGHYIIPNVETCVIGGTHQDHNYSIKLDAADTDHITKTCTSIIPALKDAKLVTEWAGLRPGRHEVRLEAEQRDGKLVIHNYGHGGSGLTLFWGCAGDVADVLKEKLTNTKSKL